MGKGRERWTYEELFGALKVGGLLFLLSGGHSDEGGRALRFERRGEMRVGVGGLGPLEDVVLLGQRQKGVARLRARSGCARRGQSWRWLGRSVVAKRVVGGEVESQGGRGRPVF